MFGLSPLVAGGIVAAVALLLSYYWFGVHRRRQIETAAGTTALANMKWRECLGLVLQALAREGYSEEPSSRQPGDGGSEFLLRKDGQQSLLSYKHGTAYRLGEANVRDFANALQLQGAAKGILITLGSSEAFARDLARRYDVQLIDGTALWPKLQPFVPDELRKHTRDLAAAQTGRGLQFGIIGSLLLGGVVFFATGGLGEKPPRTALASSDAAAASAPAPAAAEPASADAADVGASTTADAGAAPSADTAAVVAGGQTPASGDPATLQVQAAAQAMQEMAALTDQDKLARRAAARNRASEIARVRSANWSTQSTLVLGLRDTSGDDQAVVDETCRILVQYEELRYTRLQLEPPEGSTAPVRWRQCQ